MAAGSRYKLMFRNFEQDSVDKDEIRIDVQSHIFKFLKESEFILILFGEHGILNLPLEQGNVFIANSMLKAMKKQNFFLLYTEPIELNNNIYLGWFSIEQINLMFPVLHHKASARSSNNNNTIYVKTAMNLQHMQ
uniref:Uncharacterized protein n=1 Tax=Glossina pallidipes TaxID=7398 RepID=A0A1A9ZVA5_GLOPL